MSSTSPNAKPIRSLDSLGRCPASPQPTSGRGNGAEGLKLASPGSSASPCRGRPGPGEGPLKPQGLGLQGPCTRTPRPAVARGGNVQAPTGLALWFPELPESDCPALPEPGVVHACPCIPFAHSRLSLVALPARDLPQPVLALRLGSRAAPGGPSLGRGTGTEGDPGWRQAAPHGWPVGQEPQCLSHEGPCRGWTTRPWATPSERSTHRPGTVRAMPVPSSPLQVGLPAPRAQNPGYLGLSRRGGGFPGATAPGAELSVQAHEGLVAVLSTWGGRQGWGCASRRVCVGVGVPGEVRWALHWHLPAPPAGLPCPPWVPPSYSLRHQEICKNCPLLLPSGVVSVLGAGLDDPGRGPPLTQSPSEFSATSGIYLPFHREGQTPGLGWAVESLLVG